MKIDNTKIFQEHITALVNYIKLGHSTLDSQYFPLLSEHIMDRLRSEYIYLENEYIESFKIADFATIDPDNVSLNIPINRKQYFQSIFANSFGPFNADEYFKFKVNDRILWLIKESYIEYDSWNAKDRGGHNQAYENQFWEDVAAISTLSKMIVLKDPHPENE